MPVSVNWPAVQHVLLDMDGTVLDLAFDNRFWRELVPRHYARARGLSEEQARAELEPDFRALRGRLEWYSLEWWSGRTGLDLVALKHAHRDGISAREGAGDFLRGARGDGRQLWLVTNADPQALDIKLMQSDLRQGFDRIVSSHEFGAPKEDRRFWERLVAAHPFDRARALFVDDNRQVLEAARDFGIGQIVAIRHPDTSRPPRDVAGFPSVDRLADLLPIPAGAARGPD